MNKVYIHYGQTEFDPELATREVNAIWSKPDKGLWGSPVDSDWGWKEWCEAEDWSCNDLTKSFKFTLEPKASILEIHKEEDILPYLIQDVHSGIRFGLTNISDKLNKEKLYSEFDGMELFISENWRMHDGFFNTWDCDSIVVWNPDLIVALKED